MAKIKNPEEEAPVNIRNFLSHPPTFCFRVKKINAKPSKKKAVPKMIKKGIFIFLGNAGIAITHAITAKTPTKA